MAPKNDLASPAPLRVMNRKDLTRRLVARLKHDEAVIGGIGNTNFDLWAVGHRPQNFYMLGSMGITIPIALGVALAQPDRGVIAIEGDGSLLMSLGCLATIGMLQPRNLTILVMDNGMYEITGRQKTATHKASDVVAISRGAGIENSVWARDEAHFEQLVDRRFENGGPHLIAVKIDAEHATEQTPRDPTLIRQRFMQGIGTGRKSALDG
jgi:thiamine pyrophosphate-dependent acetolactate synthase large subunit-like protein